REIPTQSVMLIGLGERCATCFGRNRRQKSLWRPAEPAQDEECVLASAITASIDASEGGRADWMVPTLLVQSNRLVPEHSRQIRPAESALNTPSIDGDKHGMNVKFTNDPAS